MSNFVTESAYVAVGFGTGYSVGMVVATGVKRDMP
jgi:hypothetical protein